MTQTKRDRMVMRNRYNMDKKVLKFKPPTPRRSYKFKHVLYGHEIETFVSKGQIINEYNYEKRKRRRERKMGK